MAKKRKIESSSAAMRRNVAMVINGTPTHSKTASKLAVWMVRFFSLVCIHVSAKSDASLSAMLLTI